MKKTALVFLMLFAIGCNSAPAKTKTSVSVTINSQENELDSKTDKQLGVTQTESNDEKYTPSKPSIIEDSDSTTTVKAEGVGAIQNNNHAKARDEAIWDAQRRAVEKGVGVLLASETMVSNAQLLSDNIYTQADGFVDSYKIISENKDEFLYYVTIKADVKKTNLAGKLAMLGLIKKVGDPRIMVVIPETHLRTPIPDPAGETEIIKNLVDNGYRVVDQKQIASIRNSEKVKKMAQGDTAAAMELGEQFDADIIITGEAFSQLQSVNVQNVNGLVSCGARVEYRIIKVDNGEIITAGSANAAAIGMSEAIAAKESLRKAGELIGKGGKDVYGTKIDSLIPKIATAMLKKSSIQLVITGINHDQYTKIVAVLKDERTIKGVFPREMSGSATRIDIDTDRNIEDIKKIIENIDGINLKIINSTKNKLDAKVSLPAKITLQGVKNFKELKNATDILTAKGIKTTNKKYTGTTAVIETSYSGDMFELADLYSDKYDVVSVADSEIVLKK